MSREIINVADLQDTVDEALESAPSGLQVYLSSLRANLRRAAERHGSVRTARRRKSDPLWAQAKFDAGKALYRFDTNNRNDLIKKIVNQFDELDQVAALIQKENPTISHDAAAYLRGLRHQNGTLDDLGKQAWTLIARSETAILRSRRYEVLRKPVHETVGPLRGVLCLSIDDVMRIGREAQNCLATCEDHWAMFALGDIDFWSIREGNRLVAILKVKRSINQVAEALGPSNATIDLRDVGNVAQFCATTGLEIGPECVGLLTEYAQPMIVKPRTIEIGRRIAVYAEWPNAVRIDLSNKGGRHVGPRGSAETLALSFDPARSCGESLLEHDLFRPAIARFGEKHVRRIVRAISLDQTIPTLVQHRLLTLVA